MLNPRSCREEGSENLQNLKGNLFWGVVAPCPSIMGLQLRVTWQTGQPIWGCELGQSVGLSLFRALTGSELLPTHDLSWVRVQALAPSRWMMRKGNSTLALSLSLLCLHELLGHTGLTHAVLVESRPESLTNWPDHWSKNMISKAQNQEKVDDYMLNLLKETHTHTHTQL